MAICLVKIASYNVNGINGRLPILLRWMQERQPDIVCLQELKAPDEKFPASSFRDLGYDAIWHGQKSWNGVAILSRVGEIHETRRGLPGDPDASQSRYIEAAVNGVLVAGLYMPNGNPRPGPKFDYKLQWFDRLIDHAGNLLASGAPVLLVGDFNVMPTERDVYKPDRWKEDALFAPEVRDAFFRLLDQGWTDALRTIHPDETIYTFWDYFRNAYGRNAGLRIDHLLLSPVLAGKLVDAQVDAKVRGWEKSSDHAPVWIELAAAKAARNLPFPTASAVYPSAQGGKNTAALLSLRAGNQRCQCVVDPQRRNAMSRQDDATFEKKGKLHERRLHETGGAHDYGGNPDLAGNADEPGDRVQGSDGRPTTGKQ